MEWTKRTSERANETKKPNENNDVDEADEANETNTLKWNVAETGKTIPSEWINLDVE